VKTVVALPEHWTECDENFWDDGRDYGQPQYIRKDELARIYHNENAAGKPHAFAIVWDSHSDGSCAPTLEAAIAEADAYVLRYPL
jgi:hypothetical protein